MYRLTPPELLHTSGAGLILYMFHAITTKLGARLYRNELNEQHLWMMHSLCRQSELDFPHGATRNDGIVDGTKCQALGFGAPRKPVLYGMHSIHNGWFGTERRNAVHR